MNASTSEENETDRRETLPFLFSSQVLTRRVCCFLKSFAEDRFVNTNVENFQKYIKQKSGL